MKLIEKYPKRFDINCVFKFVTITEGIDADYDMMK